jgi:hypothetical protein
LADLPTDLWAIQPTCHEITDFKKPVIQGVKPLKMILCYSCDDVPLKIKKKSLLVYQHGLFELIIEPS